MAVSAQTATRNITYGVRVNLPVEFDAGTNTVYLGNRFLGRRTPLTRAAPHFDTSRITSWSTVTTVDTVTMGGVAHNDALRFGYASNHSTGTIFTLHNLAGQYRVLNGYIGRVDGSAMANATINFIGDGRLLQSYELNATDMPVPVSVFVEDVVQLRVEAVIERNVIAAFVHYAVVAFVE